MKNPNPVGGQPTIASTRALLDQAWKQVTAMIDNVAHDGDDDSIIAEFVEKTPSATDPARVRKDVSYHVESAIIDGVHVLVYVTVKCRNKTYKGIIEHRLPLIAGVSDTFAWRSTAMTRDRKPLPTEAGQRVLHHVRRVWGEIVNEGDAIIVEILRSIAAARASSSGDIAHYAKVAGLIFQAMTELDPSAKK